MGSPKNRGRPLGLFIALASALAACEHGGTSDGSSGDGGGEAAAGGAGAGSVGGAGSPSLLHEVDLTLGGFNQDLPAPSVDCATPNSSDACLSVSGTYNGQVFELACAGWANVVFVYLDNSRRIACKEALGEGDEMRVAVLLGSALFNDLPTTFEAPVANGAIAVPEETRIGMEREARHLQSHSSEEFLIFDTHMMEGKVAGEAYGREDDEFAKGVFAASLTPRATCVPDADGFGCDEVRVRGTFSARTLAEFTP